MNWVSTMVSLISILSSWERHGEIFTISEFRFTGVVLKVATYLGERFLGLYEPIGGKFAFNLTSRSWITARLGVKKQGRLFKGFYLNFSIALSISAG